MKRRQFLAATSAIALPAWGRNDRFDRGLLWHVTRAGVAPSHVFGTIHVPDKRLAELPPAVRSRFDAARSLMLEFVPDPYARERFLEAAMFLDRQTLAEKIGAEDFERALEQLAPIGLARETVNKLKPWGVLLNLRDPHRAAEGAPLDEQLIDLARVLADSRCQLDGEDDQN
jgi:uncharacterized protein YbaP (TraB family)